MKTIRTIEFYAAEGASVTADALEAATRPFNSIDENVRVAILAPVRNVKGRVANFRNLMTALETAVEDGKCAVALVPTSAFEAIRLVTPTSKSVIEVGGLGEACVRVTLGGEISPHQSRAREILAAWASLGYDFFPPDFVEKFYDYVAKTPRGKPGYVRALDNEGNKVPFEDLYTFDTPDEGEVAA